MMVDRTRVRATKRTEVMERISDRIIQEHKDLLILVVSLENSQEWRISVWDVENKNTSQNRSAQLRMPSSSLS